MISLTPNRTSVNHLSNGISIGAYFIEPLSICRDRHTLHFFLNGVFDTLFNQACAREKGKDRCADTEDETGKRCELKSLENDSFNNQAARAFPRGNELVGCNPACRQGRWQRRINMEEIDLAQHSH